MSESHVPSRLTPLQRLRKEQLLPNSVAYVLQGTGVALGIMGIYSEPGERASLFFISMCMFVSSHFLLNRRMQRDLLLEIESLKAGTASPTPQDGS